MTLPSPSHRRPASATAVRRVTTLALAIASALAVTQQAHAQYRVDNSSARDANNRVGSGGFNGGMGAQRVGGLAGNYIVTGNVTGGRAFRGSLGYTDPTQFRGSLGSAAFDNFYRDSVGFGTARGGFAGNNNYATIQPYFGPGATVAPPSGFVRDPSRGGGFVPSPRTLVQSNDARLDYGGASRSEVTQGILNSSRVIGGPGYNTNPSTINGYPGALGSGIAPFDISAPAATQYQLSEYTTLARTRPGLLDMPIGSDPLLSDTGVNRLRNAGGQVVNPNVIQPNPGDPTPAGSTAINTLRDPGANAVAPLDSRVNPVAARPGDTDNATGANAAANDPTTVLRGNSQYAELRRRVEAADQTKRLPGQEAVERNNALIQQRKAAQDKTNGKPNDDKTAKPALPGANPNGPGAGATPDADNSRTGAPAAIDPRRDPRIQPTIPGAGGGNLDPAGRSPVGDRRGGATTEPTAGPDTLNLPRPQEAVGGNAPDKGNRPATAPAANGGDEPMRIQSLATGVNDVKLADSLKRAENLMKDGKFATAIDIYERSRIAAKDDPIIFMGQAIAELGGSYYRPAEKHLRQGFNADRALLYAKFDLRQMLGDQRLNFLVGDLSETARTNPKDPGPLLLLAFIYYNGGMEDRAARALQMAKTRANGNDSTVSLLQQSWKLPAEQPGAPGGQEPSTPQQDEPTK